MVARVTHGLLLAALLFLSGCDGFIGWMSIYTSRSPDGKREVSVDVKKCLADCAVRVVLNEGWWTSTQFGSGDDCVVKFVHTVWVESSVGVYAYGMFCGPIKVAYDFNAKRAIPFTDVEKDMRSSIIADYGVTRKELAENGGDALKWASFPGDGQVRRSIVVFRERYWKDR